MTEKLILNRPLPKSANARFARQFFVRLGADDAAYPWVRKEDKATTDEKLTAKMAFDDFGRGLM